MNSKTLGLVGVACASWALFACTKPAPEPSKSESVPSNPERGSSASGLPGTPVTSVSSAAPSASAPGLPPMYAVSGSSGATAQDDLVWEVPKSWTSQPNPNTMRKATYKVPRGPSDSEDAECAVSQAGGNLEDNIKRWQAQFEGAPPTKRSERKVSNINVTVVEIQGTFLGSGMGPSTGKKAGTTMLAAIVATEPPHFFKLVGPTNSVNLAKPDFDKLLGSIKRK